MNPERRAHRIAGVDRPVLGLHRKRFLGGAPSAPAAPDPVATANAQSAMNEKTARTTAALNRVNQVGPDGSITYSNNSADPGGVNWVNQQVASARDAAAASGDTGWEESGARKYFESQKPADTDSYTMTTSLSPENQRLYDLSQQAKTTYGEAANQQLNNVSGMLSTPFDGRAYQGAGDVALGTTMGATQRAGQLASQPFNTDFGSVRQQAIDAANSRLQPQFKQQEDELRTRLLNSGVPEGSEQWNRAYRQMNEGQNDSRQQTILNAEQLTGQAIGQAGQLRAIPLDEQARIASMAGGQGNQATQAMQTALALRAQPTNEAAALLTGQQVGVPQLQQTPQTQVAPTDYIGAVNNNYAGQLNAYNSANQRASAGLGGIASLAGSLAQGGMMLYKASDRRLKTDIRRVGKTDGGLPLYAYRYKAGGPHQIGVMAQDVAKVRPDAVGDIGGGFLGVDYRKVA